MRISDWSSDVCSSDLLTGGQHVSDASNASRTQLMALDGTDWDIGLCDLFGVPPQALPEIVDNIGAFGATQAEWFGQPIAIRGLMGDQQAATIGQACLTPRSEEHTSELQSLMRHSYSVFCLKKKKKHHTRK